MARSSTRARSRSRRCGQRHRTSSKTTPSWCWTPNRRQSRRRPATVAPSSSARRRLACVGDCGGDGMITVDELITGVNVNLGDSTSTSAPRSTVTATAACGRQRADPRRQRRAGRLPARRRASANATVALRSSTTASAASTKRSAPATTTAATACAPDDTRDRGRTRHCCPIAGCRPRVATTRRCGPPATDRRPPSSAS